MTLVGTNNDVKMPQEIMLPNNDNNMRYYN